MTGVGRFRIRGFVGIVLIALLSCHASGPVTNRGLPEAVLAFVLKLPDATGSAACQRFYVHPWIGDEYYSIAENMRRPWHKIARLPVRDDEQRRRDGRTFVFAPFRIDSLADGCIAYSAHIRPNTPGNEMQLYVEVFENKEGRWLYSVNAFAIGRETEGSLEFILRDIQG